MAMTGAWSDGFSPLTAQDVKQEVDENQIQVTVENRHFNDVRVYAVAGTRSWKLGNVTGMTEDTFVVPRFLTVTNEPLRIVAYPIGTASVVRSHDVLVSPGDEVVYRVESRLPLSNIRVIPQT